MFIKTFSEQHNFSLYSEDFLPVKPRNDPHHKRKEPPATPIRASKTSKVESSLVMEEANQEIDAADQPDDEPEPTDHDNDEFAENIDQQADDAEEGDVEGEAADDNEE